MSKTKDSLEDLLRMAEDALINEAQIKQAKHYMNAKILSPDDLMREYRSSMKLNDSQEFNAPPTERFQLRRRRDKNRNIRNYIPKYGVAKHPF